MFFHLYVVKYARGSENVWVWFFSTSKYWNLYYFCEQFKHLYLTYSLVLAIPGLDNIEKITYCTEVFQLPRSCCFHWHKGQRNAKNFNTCEQNSFQWNRLSGYLKNPLEISSLLTSPPQESASNTRELIKRGTAL